MATGETKRLEQALTACLILLKLSVLHGTFGRMQGFDCTPWMDVFHVTDWFKPLPNPRAMFGSYHPPLSYLLARWIYRVYPHDVECSQILSTIAAIGTVLSIRSVLRTMGVLWTIPGLTMLYCSTSIPLIVWMGIETSYDALVFMWFVLAMAISAKVFWDAGFSWRRPAHVAGVVCLGLVLAAGLLTKFNALLAFELPILVLLARRGRRLRRGELGAALVAMTLGVALVAPFYYVHYYKLVGQVFPQAMEWRRTDDLKAAIAARDADRWRFVLHMIRIPTQRFVGSQEPARDSFFSCVWLHTWKKDRYLGDEAHFALHVGDFYARAALLMVLVGTSSFLFRASKLPEGWRHLGVVLLVVAVSFCVTLLYFGWKYPLWDWTVFKAKYITPATLWISYCVAVTGMTLLPRSGRAPRLNRLKTRLGVLLLMVVVFIDHIVPVY